MLLRIVTNFKIELLAQIYHFFIYENVAKAYFLSKKIMNVTVNAYVSHFNFIKIINLHILSFAL